MRTFRAIAAALTLFGLAACDKTGTGIEGNSGSFSILLTDAPGDFERAVVTIDKIYLQGDGGEVVLRQDQVTADLLTLQNEVLDLVKNVTVPSGTYSELRLVISGGFIEVEQEDGSTRIYASSAEYAAQQGVTAHGTLQMPSFAQSGLKIKLPGGSTRVDGDQHILLLDFNVAQSFGRAAGQSNRWVMRPVIKASDFGLTGGVEVNLRVADTVQMPLIGGQPLTLAAFKATLNKNGDIITSSFEDTDGDGTFTARLRFLEPGTYPVGLSVPEGVSFTSDKALPQTFTVQSGATARDLFTLTAVTYTTAQP